MKLSGFLTEFPPTSYLNLVYITKFCKISLDVMECCNNFSRFHRIIRGRYRGRLRGRSRGRYRSGYLCFNRTCITVVLLQ